MRTLPYPILCLVLFGTVTATCLSTALADEINFDDQPIGELPDGWISGVSGKGGLSFMLGSGDSRWTVEQDDTAPSSDQVFRQSAEGKFPWAVVKDTALSNGYVQTRFKTISGKEDQAAGLIWRWQDEDNYYVTRANSLEDNVSIYYMKDGRRHTLKYVDTGADNLVMRNEWHTLRVEFNQDTFVVLFNDMKILEIQDQQIEGSGAVGLWTKADSVTEFDDFEYGE